jgi:hypothetical protein
MTFQERELAADPTLAVCPQDLVILLLETTGSHNGDMAAGDGEDFVSIHFP